MLHAVKFTSIQPQHTCRATGEKNSQLYHDPTTVFGLHYQLALKLRQILARMNENQSVND